MAWVEPDPKKQYFSRFRVPFDYPAHSLQETVLPQINGTDGKPRLKVYLLLVWGVCDQALGRNRPLKSEKLKIRIYTRRKFTDSKNAILFDLRRKINLTKLSRKKTVSEEWRHQALVNAWPS